MRLCAPSLLVVLAVKCSAQAPDPAFVLEARSLHPYTASYLGNGSMSVAITQLGVTPAPSFLAGIYDHTPGDVARIASAPAWNTVDIYNGVHWLGDQVIDGPFRDYRQTLDMFNGLLTTSYAWVDGDRTIRVKAKEFTSRDRSAIGGIRVTLTPEFTGTLTVRFPLRNWPPPHRYPLARLQKLDTAASKNPWLIWYPGHFEITGADAQRHGTILLESLSGAAPGGGPKLGEAVVIDGLPAAEVGHDSLSAAAESKMEVHSGEEYAFTKYAAVVTSDTADPTSQAEKIALAVQQEGWQPSLATSENAWHHLWEADILVDGSPDLQRTIHSMLFYLLGSTRAGLPVSIPPMGLSSSGYYGHIFWDADTYLFPPLVILHPELARPMVAFRSRTREAAKQNAQRNGFKGAMFPWEADADGIESTPKFAFQNATSENHVNGDVALAAWQYWQATGDREWLEQDAWPLLRDTADFWTSRVHLNARQNRYEIAGVVAVKESDIGVSNDAYTNAVAKKNLELAVEAARLVREQSNPKWHEIAQKMYVPPSDSPLLSFPLDLMNSEDHIWALLRNLLPEVQQRRTGAMMGTEFFPLLAAQIGDRTLIGQLLEPLSAPYLRPPFQVIAETPDNQNTSFITGAGAFLQQFIFGYSGLRFSSTGLERKFKPVLPPGIRKLTLKNITLHGKRQTLTFAENE